MTDDFTVKLAHKIRRGILNEIDAGTSRTKKDNLTKTIYPSQMSIDDQQTDFARQQLIALVRDAEENDTNAQAILLEMLNNIIHTGPKLSALTADDDFNTQFSNFYNSVWSKDADYLEPRHYSALLKILFTRALVDGECLLVFDDFLENSGKLLLFEATHLQTLSDSCFESWLKTTSMGIAAIESPQSEKNLKKSDFRQSKGVLTNKLGKVLGYLVCSIPGQTVADDPDTITFMPISSARKFKFTSHYRQKTGISRFAAAVEDMKDVRKIRMSRLEALKSSAQRASVYKTSNKNARKAMAAGTNLDKLVDSLSSGKEVPIPNKINIDQLEDYSDAVMTIGQDEELTNLKEDRPSMNAQEFDKQTRIAGSHGSTGLTSPYTTGVVDGAYTGFRGSQIMAWCHFQCYQKELERQILDFVHVKVAVWAAEQGLIPNPPENFEAAIYYTHYKMPEVDQLKAVNAQEKRLKNNIDTYSDVHGPGWRGKMDQAADERQYAAENGLIDLNVFTDATRAQAYHDDNKTLFQKFWNFFTRSKK